MNIKNIIKNWEAKLNQKQIFIGMQKRQIEELIQRNCKLLDEKKQLQRTIEGYENFIQSSKN